ncbi:amylo-alpha-1,6-glucosidase, partial [Micromonospora deserti]
MIGKTVSILDGNTFIVTDERGDMSPSPAFPTGLFYFDTRFLSVWALSINGQRLSALSKDEVQYFETHFFLVPGEPTHYVDAKVSVIREQSISADFIERLTVLNHDIKPARFTLRLDVSSDFADLFEIKDVRRKSGSTSVQREDGRLRLCYTREQFRRETIISSSAAARVDDGGMCFDIVVESRGSWHVELRVQPIIHGARAETGGGVWGAHRKRRLSQQLRRDLEHWLKRVPQLSCDYEPLQTAYERSIVDLAAMRFTTLSGGMPIPTAGLPWFMTIFGRDSIFICLQALPFAPQLAPPVLRLLAALQGSRLNDFREEEPGKIPHELRYGESAAFQEQPHSPYYGSADATPLFVILLDEYERWSGDAKLVRYLEHDAREALDWIDEYGDLLGNGYISYWRRNTVNGLENQCWKDSPDSISY